MESEDDSDWEEEEQERTETSCLFCDKMCVGTEAALRHCHMEHNFNIVQIQKFHNMDCFGFIKMINFMRKMVRGLTWNTITKKRK